MISMKRGKLTLENFKASKHYPLFLDVLYFLIAFFLTFGIYILIFKSLGFYPFDEKGLTTMMLDQRDQYISYMRTYQETLRNGGSLVYSLSKVFGGDFQSLFTYYLSSPFNVFVVFVSSNDIPAFFFYTSIIKMSFAAGNMYLLGRFVTKKRRVGYLSFSIAYGLISYAFVYLSNFMYLDGLMILPLVFLGMRFLEKRKEYWLYSLSLAYALLSNWYLGAMICIFLVVYFLLRFAWMKGDMHTRLRYLTRFLIFSLAGGFLSSFVWLTAFSHFDGTKASTQLPSLSFFNWASFFEGLLENNYLSRSAISRNTGYMTMFVSVVSLLFAQLYFTNKKYSWREKSLDGSLLFVYFVVSLTSVLNALFHGGREPTWFPTRYSFIIGFYICYLSIKETGEMEDTPIWGLAVPASTSLILLPILTLLQKNYLANNREEITYPLSLTSLLIFLISFGTLALYLVFLLLSKKKKIGVPISVSYVVEVGLLILTIISSYRGGVNVVNANIKDKSYQEYSIYKKDDSLQEVFDKVKTYAGGSLYRMESTFNRPGGVNTIDNNPMFYSYNGLSHYSSTEKKNISSYMKRLGFHRNGFWERYDAGSTEAINSFLGIRYLIDQDDYSVEKPQFLYNESSLNLFRNVDDKFSSLESYHYYENEYALPLGFVTGSSSSTYISQGKKMENHQDTYWFDRFEYQNQMFQVMDPNKNGKEIFHKISFTKETISSEATLLSQNEYGENTYRLKKGSSLSFQFEIPEEAAQNTLYLDEKNGVSDLNFYLDGQRIGLNDYRDSGIHSFNAKVGSKHTLEIIYRGEKEKECSIVPLVYYEDLSILREYLSSLQEGGAKNLTEKSGVSSTSFEGDFILTKENSEFLFTLPYDKNFSIYLDGEKKETLTRFDIFTAISLKGVKEGGHHIKIVYHDKVLTGGIVLSSLSLGGIAPLIIFYSRFENWLFRKKEKENQ